MKLSEIIANSSSPKLNGAVAALYLQTRFPYGSQCFRDRSRCPPPQVHIEFNKTHHKTLISEIHYRKIRAIWKPEFKKALFFNTSRGNILKTRCFLLLSGLQVVQSSEIIANSKRRPPPALSLVSLHAATSLRIPMHATPVWGDACPGAHRI